MFQNILGTNTLKYTVHHCGTIDQQLWQSSNYDSVKIEFIQIFES